MLSLNGDRGDGSSSFLSWDEWWISGGFYSPNGDTSELLPTGKSSPTNYVNLPEGCFDHVMLRINETAVIFVGCRDNLERVYLFDKITKTFSQMPTLTIGRESPFAGK